MISFQILVLLSSAEVEKNTSRDQYLFRKPKDYIREDIVVSRVLSNVQFLNTDSDDSSGQMEVLGFSLTACLSSLSSIRLMIEKNLNSPEERRKLKEQLKGRGKTYRLLLNHCPFYFSHRYAMSCLILTSNIK